ncbi:MAG TPA: VWA domain-containing protein [Rhodanobacteraceae bacterium]
MADTHPSIATPAHERVEQLGDARHGKLAENLVAFCRALRRAGVPVDASRITLAEQALQWIGITNRQDVSAALEAVLVSREQDRDVFRELFGTFFRDPELAKKMLAQMLPGAGGTAEPPKQRPRVREALQRGTPPDDPQRTAREVDLDAAMTASRLRRLRTADFNQLTASEYHLVEHLVRDIPLPLPTVRTRRTSAGSRGARVHWGRTLGLAAQTGGDIMVLRRLRRRRAPLPLLLLVDVSGSMERYTRLLLAFLHAATARARALDGRNVVVRRAVFACGTELTDLGPAFRLADTDAMLDAAGRGIRDFAGGTRLGDCLAELRCRHARQLVGRRTLALIVSDGLDTGEPDALARELAWLKRHTRRILWLNPLLRFAGYAPAARGAAVLHDAVDGMLAVHNVTRLRELAAAIATLMRQRGLRRIPVAQIPLSLRERVPRWGG